MLINKIFHNNIIQKIDREYRELSPPIKTEIQQIEATLYRQLKKKTKIPRKQLKTLIHYTLLIDTPIETEYIQQLHRDGGSFCTGCGDCCRTHRISITPKDIKRLTSKGIPSSDFIRYKYIYTWRTRPCPYLDDETNKCKVYSHRPGSCRNYPITKDGSGVDIVDKLNFCGYILNYTKYKVLLLINSLG